MIGAPALRRATETDAPKIAELLGELGYSTHPTYVRERLALLDASPNDRVFVAQRNDRVLGVASVHVFALFHADVWVGRVTTIVVGSHERRQGIGGYLLAACEAFAWERRCRHIEVTTGGTHEQAPAFYENSGYERADQVLIKSRP
jgi:N-acetylglutamate synthase-like GNAT family acetyltransferase